MRVRVGYAYKSFEVELPMNDADLNAYMKMKGCEDVILNCKLLEVMDAGNPLHWFEDLVVSMDEMNFFARRMESLTKYERKVIEIFAEEHVIESMKALINLTYGVKGLSLITDFSSAEQVGRRLYLDEYLGISEKDVEMIDFIQFAERTFLEGDVKVMPYGVYVEHGFQMPDVYNGRTFPEYFYSDKIVLSLEIKNQQGDTEYLYLPANKISLDKLKFRLHVNTFAECKVTAINNVRLPEKLVPQLESLKDIQAVTVLNEFCSTVEGFAEEKLERLCMAAEYACSKQITDLTYLAKHLNDFEVVSNVNNDTEYGEYIVKESGYFDVNELILPHINYASFAEERRKTIFNSSGYVDGGSVGAKSSLEQYLNYNGAFADVLELSDSYIDFHLYSPLTAVWIIEGREQDTLYGRDLLEYQETIEERLEKYCAYDPTRGMMHYYDDDESLAKKIVIAKPAVKVIDGELYGVLECKLTEGLLEDEIFKLKEYWIGQMSDGWGEGFEQQEIRVDEGELYVSFWNSESFWNVYTEDELSAQQVQGMSY